MNMHMLESTSSATFPACLYLVRIPVSLKQELSAMSGHRIYERACTKKECRHNCRAHDMQKNLVVSLRRSNELPAHQLMCCMSFSMCNCK